MNFIKNFDTLVNNTQNKKDSMARNLALSILEAGISAVDPKEMIKRNVTLKGDILSITDLHFDLKKYRKIIIVGGGKASGKMAESLENILGKRITYGIINVPIEGEKIGNIVLNKAGHPNPDEKGYEGTKEMFNIISKSSKDDLIIALISGGGSALMPFPANGLNLEDIKQVNKLLLLSGTNIQEINIVRKHISGINGGRLAVASYPATLVCLLISDVVGNSLPTIASGPTVPDPSTYKDALDILKRYEIWTKISKNIRKHIKEGIIGIKSESPKPGNKYFSKVHNIIIGSNKIALEEAVKKAVDINSIILSSYVQGEARHIGVFISGIASELLTPGAFLKRPAIILAGGETTVTVKGSGKGGRNQELVLSASINIDGLEGVAIASMGSDGIDGSSDVAGAIADGSTIKKGIENGIRAIEYLNNNDSYTFFKKLEDCIITGPTGTNVNDLIVLTVI